MSTVNGYFSTSPTPSLPAAPSAPAAPGMPAVPSGQSAPVTVNVNPYQATPGAASTPMPTDYTALSAQYGPILPIKAGQIANIAAKVVPAGTMAAVGAAQGIARNTNGTMVKNVARIVGEAGEPLLKLSWGLVAGVADVAGKLVTFQLGDAVRALGKIFTEGAANTGALVKRITQPFSLTAAASGGNKLNMGQALGTGLATGMKALKSSFIWAIPASAINAFIDYKYKDQTDPKRLMTNFGADVIGYTATGMAGAAVGAMVGSMTLPLVGTIVGAGVGIILGMAHDKVSRPMISDTLRDMMA